MKTLILAHALRVGGGRSTCTNILNALCKLDSKSNTAPMRIAFVGNQDNHSCRHCKRIRRRPGAGLSALKQPGRSAPSRPLARSEPDNDDSTGEET
jgi:hypothetical protein